MTYRTYFSHKMNIHGSLVLLASGFSLWTVAFMVELQ